jgi:signal transduction histidine kinase
MADSHNMSNGVPGRKSDSRRFGRLRFTPGRHLVMSVAVAATALFGLAAIQFVALKQLREANEHVHAVARLEQLSSAQARRITLIRATLFPAYERDRGAATRDALHQGLADADAAVDAFVAFQGHGLSEIEDERALRAESARAFVSASRDRLAFLEAAGAETPYPAEDQYLALRQENLEAQEVFQSVSSQLLADHDADEGAAGRFVLNTTIGSAVVLLLLFIGYVWVESVLANRAMRAEFRGRIAEQLSAHRGDMVNLASHELRNPLSVILLTSELMESAAAESGDEVLAEAAADAKSAALRADSIVGELLDLGRIDAERLVLNIQPIAVGPLIAEALTRASDHHGPRQTSIDCGTDMVVLADPDRLRIIIRNVVDNAYKYSAPGTTVRISVRRQGGATVMEVADEGPGIAEAALEEVFSRFGRLQATSHVSGIGIGLHLSRELARRMAGDLSARHNEDGACFVLSLPTAKAVAHA